MAVTTKFADSPRNGCWGDRPYAIIDWAGPASYTQITTGSATVPTGGQAIVPSNFGLASIEGIFMVGGSLTGSYIVVAFQTTSYNQGLPNTTWTLMWIDANTGAEMTSADLSAETVRLIAFGPY